uniref:Cadherin domain-containing protein n=1 Tax=Tetraodon nigroviridis TaxID=99883 RepID=H3CD56_TETNG
MFAINPVTGVIRVNAGGLDREKHPTYTLTVQAADMEGNGLTGEAKVLLTITAGNTPASTPTWVIPDINVAENHRGPHPLRIAQIRSNQDKLWRIHYSISGPGADQPPVNLFTMDKVSGTLFVTQQLDREQQASYMLKAHAVAEGSGTAEEPMDIIVNVIDQNDNKPVFVKDTFLGKVPEASPTNFEVIQVEATDLDEPNSDNSDIRYSILSQEPKLPSDNLFAINPVTGVIRVNAGGLDREKHPTYTLTVQAADMEGNGLTGEAKVLLTVTAGNTPASTPSAVSTAKAAALRPSTARSHLHIHLPTPLMLACANSFTSVGLAVLTHTEPEA